MDIDTVALFGASGKMGGHIIPLLEERGLRMRALVHRTPIDNKAVESIQGSVVDPAPVREVVRGADVVVQMATTKEDPQTFFDVSIRGTFNVLEACRGEDIKQFILFGGDAAMGIWFYEQPIPIDENHPLAASPGYYAFSKVMEETMAQQYAVQYGVPVSILRSSWVFENDDLLSHFSLLENVDPAEKGHGFGEVPQHVIDLVKKGEERIPILLDRNGVPFRRHIVHVDDVMQALGKMLGNPSAIGDSFNIAGPTPFEYRVTAEYISQKTGTPTIELACPEYHSFEINITRARTVLGYAPQNDIFRMVDRALEYRQKKGK